MIGIFSLRLRKLKSKNDFLKLKKALYHKTPTRLFQPAKLFLRKIQIGTNHCKIKISAPHSKSKIYSFILFIKLFIIFYVHN